MVKVIDRRRKHKVSKKFECFVRVWRKEGYKLEHLIRDELLFSKNYNAKLVNKKKNLPVHANVFAYRIERLFQTNFPDEYIIDFKGYKVKAFSLESLTEIISVVEQKLEKGIRRPLIFYSDSILVMTDNLTVSLTEYVIYYYKTVHDMCVYITHGQLENDQFTFGLKDDDMHVYNGFFVGEAGRGFMHNSFILDWYPGKQEILEDEFYAHIEDSRRFKTMVGNGPWDASIAISDCSDFLEKADVEEEAINAVCDVVGELAPNAVEHGNSNCIMDMCYERSTSISGQNLTNISMVIFNFSEKLLWSDLYTKIFVGNKEITHRKERVDTVRAAWESHRKQFTSQYSDNDFYNLIAFQKISGRSGDRGDGGLGINTLIQNVQKYCTDDYCYVLSGHGALLMDKELTVPDTNDYIAFNCDHEYVNKIPDDDAVMQTKFFMPGVAYNLIFYFEEVM
jgi:hypothetical protein